MCLEKSPLNGLFLVDALRVERLFAEVFKRLIEFINALRVLLRGIKYVCLPLVFPLFLAVATLPIRLIAVGALLAVNSATLELFANLARLEVPLIRLRYILLFGELIYSTLADYLGEGARRRPCPS